MGLVIVNKPLPSGATHQTPNRIVLHAMGEYIKTETGEQHAYDFLKNTGLSAHALICPDGTILKCREDNQGAYHARGFNKDSLGVEFLVQGVHTYDSFLKAIGKPYLTFEQHVSGVELLRQWCFTHAISLIDTHSALSPGRKQDPGAGFPLKQFLIDVKRGQ